MTWVRLSYRQGYGPHNISLACSGKAGKIPHANSNARRRCKRYSRRFFFASASFVRLGCAQTEFWVFVVTPYAHTGSAIRVRPGLGFNGQFLVFVHPA